MGLRDNLTLSKFYRCLVKNPGIYPDLEINKQLKKKDNVLANVQKDGAYYIFFTYENDYSKHKNQNLRKMRIIYDPSENYQFTIWAESKNLIHSKQYELVNGEARNFFESWFQRDIVNCAGVKVANLGKMRGKKIDSSFIVGDDSEKGNIVGYVLTRKEPFYNNVNKLKMEIYDDLDGLSMLCDNIDVLVENMVITKGQKSSPGSMFG